MPEVSATSAEKEAVKSMKRIVEEVPTLTVTALGSVIAPSVLKVNVVEPL